MYIRLFHDDRKLPFPDKARAALTQPPGAVAIGVRADEDAPPAVDGVPVGVSTSGLVLRKDHFELVYHDEGGTHDESTTSHDVLHLWRQD